MPEKVISGGFLIPGAVEAEVPSWAEFKDAVDRLWQEFGYVNANKQELWDAINQLKGDPAADIGSELRKLRDAAFAANNQINGPLPDGLWTIWQCIENHGDRLNSTDKRIDSLQSEAKAAFKSVIDDTLHPIFQYGLDQAIRKLMTLEEENRRLRSDLESLRSEVQSIRGHLQPT